MKTSKSTHSWTNTSILVTGALVVNPNYYNITVNPDLHGYLTTADNTIIYNNTTPAWWTTNAAAVNAAIQIVGGNQLANFHD